MDTTFDPAMELLKGHPELKIALEEWDALLADRRALQRSAEEAQKLLDDVDTRIGTFQAEFPSRFTITVKKPPVKGRVTRSTPAPKPVPSRDSKAKPKQTMPQWMSGVKAALKANTPLLAEEFPNQDAEWWRSQYDQGVRPGEAAAAFVARMNQVAQAPTRKLSEPDPEGLFTFPSKLGITEQDLNLGISLQLRPSGDEEFDRALIGVPLNTNKGFFAVVHMNARESHQVYHLHPIESATGKRRIEWHDRKKQFPKLDPLDVPLCGVYVQDEQGQDYLLGEDSKRIYCEVPKKKA